MKRKETDVARPIVNHLESCHWDVYQEVLAGGPRADIVALQGRLIWVVEVKTTLTFDVLEQAVNWLDHAHYVSIAVPDARTHRSMAIRFCRELGVGVFETLGDHVTQRLAPKLGRTRLRPTFVERLRSSCIPECKTWGEAGNATAEYYSPFRGTCRAVVEYLKEHGPSPVKEVVDGIKHHYASDTSARACIPRWAQYGKIKGVRVDATTRPLRLVLEGAA